MPWRQNVVLSLPREVRFSRSEKTTLALAMVIAAGCSSKPDRIPVPELDPEQSAAQAMELYDKSHDGSLSAEERKDAPSLESAMPKLDKDRDGNLTAQEIAARIRSYQDFKAALVSANCALVRGGQPVAGAKVTYEPETFMGEAILPAFGTTNERGVAALSVASEHLPSPAHAGMNPGFYRVRVTLADGTDVKNLNAGAESAGDDFNNHRVSLP